MGTVLIMVLSSLCFPLTKHWHIPSPTAFFSQRISSRRNQIRGLPKWDDRVRDMLEAGRERRKHGQAHWQMATRWKDAKICYLQTIKYFICACIYMGANTRILMRSATKLYEDDREDTKAHLGKDKAMSLGDVDCLREMDRRLPETCTLLLKDVVSFRFWCLYVSQKIPKTLQPLHLDSQILTILLQNSTNA